jgi:tetratricopeptide (TPR) repeat protein
VTSLPSAVLRALQGLSDNSGRTVVVAGPPTSGKSALLGEVRTILNDRHARIVELRGTYRGRSIPFGALDGLRQDPTSPPENRDAPEGEGPAGDAAVPDAPMAPIAYLPDRMPHSGRSRAGRARTSFLGQPIRARAANEGDPEAYWQDLVRDFRSADNRPVAILIDDGALFDPDSREFIVALSKKARLRPLLIVCALDSSVPGYMSWEDSFLGRGDVDWVRFTQSLPDAREAHRLKAIFDDLPTVTQRVVGYVALLGGTVGEVVLSRVARLNYPQLAEALLPATGAGVVKVNDGRVSIPHVAWIGLTRDLLPSKQVTEMHLEIANALAALSPEPTPARRVEVAQHYLAWYPGPMALKHLLEAGELSLHLVAFDSAEELLAQAITCLPSLPAGERDRMDAELRLLHAQALFCAGRPTEGEAELREGLDSALRAKIPPEIVAEWMEFLVLTMRVVGPRPALQQSLAELADRAHDVQWIEIEALLQSLLAEYYSERGQSELARYESRRAGSLAQSLPPGHLQATALLAVGLVRVEGTPEEQALAAKFLSSARMLLGRARRWELDHMAADIEARILDGRGEWQKALQQREQAIPGLQRQKVYTVELYHELSIAATLLDHRNGKGVESVLARAALLVETLHLLPPSPCLLRLWLLEGRFRAIAGETSAARDRWEAIVDAPAAAGLPAIRTEALYRLALLEHASGRADVASRYTERLLTPELSPFVALPWQPGLADLAALAGSSLHGGAPLPVSPPGSGRRKDGQGTERPRRETVRDRHSADDQ